MSRFLSFVATSLLLTNTFFADCTWNKRSPQRVVYEDECDAPVCEKGHELNCEPLGCAYNGSAHYRIIDPCSCSQIYATASFLYWEALEDGLTMGWALPSASGTTLLPNLQGRRLKFDFGFNPGFKLGLGSYFSRYDDWAVNVNWTHFASTKKNRDTAKPGFVFISNEWVQPNNGGGSAARIAKNKWGLLLNLLDFDVSRPFYNGKRLTLSPFVGGRAAWIGQKFRVEYISPANITISDSYNKSSSWALGARGGLNANWLLGMGFRMQGNAAASLLFTDYHINHEEFTTTDLKILHTSQHQVTGRFMSEMGVGLGWGTYFKKCMYHFDFSASYDFSYMPQQNVMRQVVNDYNLLSATGAHDLFIHGLTVSGRLDF